MKYLLAILSVTITTASFAQKKNEISLLNDRFYMTFPDSATNTPRSPDIMAADYNTDSETRVIYDEGDKRLVFFAEEMDLKSVPDLEGQLKKELDGGNPFLIETSYEKDSVKCIMVTPTIFDNSEQAILMNYLVIKNPDNTLSRVSVYLNPKGFEEKERFEKIIAATLKSFKKGKRRINLTARTETFPVLGSGTKMELKVPANYVFSIDRKYDFEVYKLKKVTDYGAYNDMSTLILYFGFHPSWLNPDMGLDKYKVADSDGEFMLQKIKWLNFEDTVGSILLREQVFVDDDIQQNAQIHIAMIATNPKYITELSEAIKSSLLKYKK